MPVWRCSCYPVSIMGMHRIQKKDRPLTRKMEAFALAVVELSNQAEAYRRVYAGIKTADSTIYEQSTRLMADPRIYSRVAALKAERNVDSRMALREVLEHYKDLATADPHEYADYRRTCCRWCWGKDNRYQWLNEDEWAMAVAEAVKDDRPLPTHHGGFGFNRTFDPNADCPRCHGEGVESVYFADTRKIKGASRRLFSGIKTSKNGIEIKFRDQDKALDALARIHGLLQPKEPAEGSGDGTVSGGMPDLFPD